MSDESELPPDETRMVCPHCGQPVELPAEEARIGIACPGCGKDFDRPPEQAASQRAFDHQQSVARLRRAGDGFEVLAILCAIVAGLLFVGGLLDHLSTANDPSTNTFTTTAGYGFMASAGWLAFAAAFLCLVGQVIHIRANTAR